MTLLHSFARLQMPVGNSRPVGGEWSHLSNKLISDRAHVVGQRHEVRQAEDEANCVSTIHVHHVDADEAIPRIISKGADINIASRADDEVGQDISCSLDSVEASSMTEAGAASSRPSGGAA